MGPSWPGPGNRGAHVTEGCTSLAGKGHKTIPSQTRDLGHFSKLWEIQVFLLFCEGRKKRKKERRMRPSAVLSPSLRVPAPAWPGDTSQPRKAAPWPRSRLRPAHQALGASGWAPAPGASLACSSAEQTERPRPTRSAPGGFISSEPGFVESRGRVPVGPGAPPNT